MGGEQDNLPFSPNERDAKRWAWEAYGDSLFHGDPDVVEEEFEECKQDYLGRLAPDEEPDDSFWFSWVAWVMSMTMRRQEPEDASETKLPWED